MNHAQFGPSRLRHTYSIIAIDAETKELGVAMQTHNFAACNGVAWVEPGTGVVVSQAASDPYYAFAGFALMRLGKTPEQVLPALRQGDPHAEQNQVAMLDVQGHVAAFTGQQCIGETGHVIGLGYACQANIMRNDTVWPEMARAFEASRGALVDRLMAALEAAQRAGGDIRGAQSAVIKVVSTERPAEPWEGYQVDFRVYDHPQPLAELRRLIDTQRAHEQASEAEAMLAGSDLSDSEVAASWQRLQAALGRIPNQDSRLQLQFSYGLTLFNKGKTAEALPMLQAVFAADSSWREVARRLARKHPDEPYARQLDQILGK